MVGNQLNTVIEAVPEPMLHLDAAGLDRRVEHRGAGPPGDWIQGRSYAAVLRQPALLGRIETVAERTATPARRDSSWLTVPGVPSSASVSRGHLRGLSETPAGPRP